jgi:hypothetical protein
VSSNGSTIARRMTTRTKKRNMMSSESNEKSREKVCKKINELIINIKITV